MTYISWFSDFALYLEYYLLDQCHTWDITSLWPDYWRQNISLLVWPIFHGSVILPYILNTICWINVTPRILLPCDPMNDHLLYLGQCDLYFMVQWFFLISWILFVGSMSHLGYYFLVTRLLTSKYISVGVTYISWFSDFALYLEYYLLDKCHTWDITSMWPNEWPLTVSRSLWPVFHGSVILPYILNTICWINVTPGILVPCDPIIDVKIYLCWCDLYFMVQWFCLISWILFVG